MTGPVVSDPDAVRPPRTEPADFERDAYRPERVRAQLAFALMALVGLTVAFVAAQVTRGYWEQTREFAEVILTGELTALGSAIGFYFAAQR